ncbi:MAG: DUF4337 family protein [Capsulimonadaceae bacterium]
MPEEVEVPLEHAQEHIAEEHEHAAGHAEGGGEPHAEGWIRFIAVVTAVLAVVAAIGALQSGLLINEALLQKNDQISHLTQASDTWNEYQADGLKAEVFATTAQLLPAASPDRLRDLALAASHKSKQADLRARATGLTVAAGANERTSQRFLERHHVFAISVSLCQIAIALSAIAALTRRRPVWYFGLVTGIVGTAFLIVGFAVP